MRLKRLEILGFKSFADKTKLQFDAGITAIVGPNGCGKSNIADAFRWVLGEQSAKSMRGIKMPDVIFAGTNHRKPLNFAEVTITLSDIEGSLPLEYEEIAVTRRLHRSGESDYFINRQPVRLKDVQNLFLDTGIGKDAYSIFEQGKIDQVINFSPLERRYIFEEAAGILRFLQRKKEALRKLESTDHNVSRIKDIHQEVEKQIIVLEQQAEKARVYKDNKTLLERLEKGVLFAKWLQLQERVKEAEKKCLDQKEQIFSVNHLLESLQAQLQEAKTDLASAEKTLRVKSEEVFKARSHKEIKTKEKQNNQERLAEVLAKEKRWQQELEMMIEKRKLRQLERINMQSRNERLEKEVDAKEILLNEQRSKVASIETLLNKFRDQQTGNQKELLQLLKHQSQCESELKQTALRIENMQEQKNLGEEKQEKFSQILSELTQNIEIKKKQVDEASSIIDDQKISFEAMEQVFQDLSEEIQKTQSQLDIIHQDITEGNARQKVLLRLREEMEGFSSGTKRLMHEASNPNSPLFKKLVGLHETILPENGAEKSLAVVMRPYAQTLVVESESDFQAVVDFAKKENLKDFSLFCRETSLSNASEKKPTEQKLIPLLKKVSDNPLSQHFLDNIFLSKGEQSLSTTLKNKEGVEICVEEGYFIDRRYVVFFASQGENNVFLREAELKMLASKLKSAEENKQQLDNFLKVLHQKKNHLQQERLELDKTIRRQEMKLVEINFTWQKLKGDQEKILAESKQLKSEIDHFSLSIERLSATLKELSGQSQQSQSMVADKQKQANKVNEELEKQLVEHKKELHDLKEKEVSFQQAFEENRQLLHSLHVLEIKDVESKHQENRLEEEIEMCRSLQTDGLLKGKEYEKILQDVESSLADVAASCAEFEQDVTARKVIIEHNEAKLQEKRNQLKKLESTHHQFGIQIAQLESTRQSLENELKERYQMTIEEAKQAIEPLQGSLESAEKEIRILRQEMQNSGDINMTSIEECDKHKTRYVFLNQQIDDLNMSKKELIEIITQLDSESRKIFKETFDKISANFKKNFKILFNGGEADLQFTEAQDVLDAGIEIIAKPPGKQMRSINLLSGGEKCLTAVALLFAIFEVKPSPFCILDEIDAPLDDTNVERFANIVKQYMDRCQFIIITHNKRTMAIADVLFGVSMEEKGVSKLLSMEFAENESVEPVLV